MFRSPLLNDLLAAELAAGNEVREEGPGFGGMARLVLLAVPFRTPADRAASPLEFREVGDPHYWKSEVEDVTTREVLACRF